MTINLLFFTVTLKLNKMTKEEAVHQEKVKKIYEENASKICQYRHFM
ncbi:MULTISPECIES: YrzI family small protein [Bacillus]|nr:MULTISPECIES: YrzI family small protein [Bacillus]